jgi:hypothetical protein
VAPQVTDNNGILGRIPGEYIARASQALPDPAKATEARMSAEVDTTAVWSGLVRITFERAAHKHNKHRWHSWVAVYAEKV